MSRLQTSLTDGSLSLPPNGRIAVFGAPDSDTLALLPRDRTDLVLRDAVAGHALERDGWQVVEAPSRPCAAAIVTVPRAKDLARGWIRLATEVVAPGGPVVVDGQKTDGIEPLLKACKARVAVAAQISKAHGKLFWFAAEPVFADWPTLEPSRNADGYFTAPGVFSADGVDPASALLRAALPRSLGRRVADFGAGWGYLAEGLLSDPGLETLWLVEADRAALACARLNVTDPRADFVWADATTWKAPEPLDTVVMNPPFHTGRAADPDLGRAFIASAARSLTSSGTLWLVANRHLPYERSLTDHFRTVTETAGDARFKVLQAQGPIRVRRRR